MYAVDAMCVRMHGVTRARSICSSTYSDSIITIIITIIIRARSANRRKWISTSRRALSLFFSNAFDICYTIVSVARKSWTAVKQIYIAIRDTTHIHCICVYVYVCSMFMLPQGARTHSIVVRISASTGGGIERALSLPHRQFKCGIKNISQWMLPRALWSISQFPPLFGLRNMSVGLRLYKRCVTLGNMYRNTRTFMLLMAGLK